MTSSSEPSASSEQDEEKDEQEQWWQVVFTTNVVATSNVEALTAALDRVKTDCSVEIILLEGMPPIYRALEVWADVRRADAEAAEKEMQRKMDDPVERAAYIARISAAIAEAEEGATEPQPGPLSWPPVQPGQSPPPGPLSWGHDRR